MFLALPRQGSENYSTNMKAILKAERMCFYRHAGFILESGGGHAGFILERVVILNSLLSLAKDWIR